MNSLNLCTKKTNTKTADKLRFYDFLSAYFPKLSQRPKHVIYDIIRTRKRKKKWKQRNKSWRNYLDSEIIYGFGTFLSHGVRSRRWWWVCEKVEGEESETQHQERDPVAESPQLHAVSTTETSPRLYPWDGVEKTLSLLVRALLPITW